MNLETDTPETGTYVRTTAIDDLVTRFLATDDEQRKQIISLGAGSDTRALRLLSNNSNRPVYHELDFSVNTTSKIRTIRATPLLQKALGLGENNVTISEMADALHSPWYHIHPVDLRSLPKRHDQEEEDGKSKTARDILEETVDPTLPTLLISECCLVYLSPTEADAVVHYFTNTLFPRRHNVTAPLGLILYEPIRPDDAFGRVMVSNLATRGIHLQTLHRYASLEAQRKRLKEQGFDRGQDAVHVDFIWERWVSEGEKERIAGLEMLDEMEEWRLLARHYCVAWGWRDGEGSVGRGFDKWTSVAGQQGD